VEKGEVDDGEGSVVMPAEPYASRPAGLDVPGGAPARDGTPKS